MVNRVRRHTRKGDAAKARPPGLCARRDDTAASNAQRSRNGVRLRWYPAERKASPRRASTTTTRRLKSRGRREGWVCSRVHGRGQAGAEVFGGGDWPSPIQSPRPGTPDTTRLYVASPTLDS